MTVKIDSYMGKPLIVIGTSEDDRYAFQFGPGKATKLLKAIAQDGLSTVLDALMEVAEGELTEAESAILNVYKEQQPKPKPKPKSVKKR